MRPGPRGSCRSASAPRSGRRAAPRARASARTGRRGSRARRSAGARPDGCADRVGTAVLDTVDRPPQRQRLTGGEVEGLARSSSGTSKVTATASSVSCSTAATVSGWNAARVDRAPGRGLDGHSDLLHVLERLEARRAAVHRLAGGRPELRGQLAPRPTRTAGRSATRGSASAGAARRGPSWLPAPARWRDAVLRQRGVCRARVIQSLDQAGCEADPHLDVGEAGVLQAMHQVVAHRRHRRAAGVRRRDRHDDRCRRRRPRPRAARRGPPGSASASRGR